MAAAAVLGPYASLSQRQYCCSCGDAPAEESRCGLHLLLLLLPPPPWLLPQQQMLLQPLPNPLLRPAVLLPLLPH
jgi:hypothetical protein